jgi:hypothetical protein
MDSNLQLGGNQVGKVFESTRHDRHRTDDGSIGRITLRTRRSEHLTRWDWIAYYRASTVQHEVRLTAGVLVTIDRDGRLQMAEQTWPDVLGRALQRIVAARLGYQPGIQPVTPPGHLALSPGK